MSGASSLKYLDDLLWLGVSSKYHLELIIGIYK